MLYCNFDFSVLDAGCLCMWRCRNAAGKRLPSYLFVIAQYILIDTVIVSHSRPERGSDRA